jgi:hypothetical protein
MINQDLANQIAEIIRLDFRLAQIIQVVLDDLKDLVIYNKYIELEKTIQAQVLPELKQSVLEHIKNSFTDSTVNAILIMTQDPNLLNPIINLFDLLIQTSIHTNQRILDFIET